MTWKTVVGLGRNEGRSGEENGCHRNLSQRRGYRGGHGENWLRLKKEERKNLFKEKTRIGTMRSIQTGGDGGVWGEKPP